MLMRGRNQGARRGQPVRVRLEVEHLEDRTVPAALTPMQVRHAYGFDQITFNLNGKSIVGDGAGQTIAIVNAYDNKNIFSDVDYFNRTFGITAGKTLYQQYGAASTWLTKVNVGGTPGADPTGGLWYLETALDVQWAHAIAPAAKILLVQAKSGSYSDLFAAVDFARNQAGVVAVSMSWGSTEWVGENAYDFHFTTPTGHLGGSNGIGGQRLAGGVTFVAAAGDDGAPGGWPAMSPNVVSVGGTRLDVDAAGNYRGEVAWTNSGGGTSKYENRPAYQASVTLGGKRTMPDVAYNADPATGVYVYSTMPLNGKSYGWWQVGGTSAGAPQWAALVAIADQGRALMGLGSLDSATQTLPALYNAASTDYHDVTSGSNGNPARPGYDLVTGRGTPYAHRVVSTLLRADKVGKLTTTTQPVTVPAAKTVKPLVYFVAIKFGAGSSSGPDRSVAVVLVESPARSTRPTVTATPDIARRTITAMPDAEPGRHRVILAHDGLAIAAIAAAEISLPEALPAPRGTHDSMPPADVEPVIEHEAERAVLPALDLCYADTSWLDGTAPPEVQASPFVEPTPEWAGSVAAAVLVSGTWGAMTAAEKRKKRRKK